MLAAVCPCCLEQWSTETRPDTGAVLKDVITDKEVEWQISPMTAAGKKNPPWWLFSIKEESMFDRKLDP